MELNINLYETTDIFLNSYLLARGFECVKVDVIGSGGKNKVAFYYQDSEGLRKAIIEYRNDDFLQLYIQNYFKTKKRITKQLREFNQRNR